jgi:hypothetical protein
MTYSPKLRVQAVAHHRNGIGGAPFAAVLFDHEGSRKVAVLFEAPDHCAVLDVSKLANGDIAFGSNSWRGDVFEEPLRRYLRTTN